MIKDDKTNKGNFVNHVLMVDRVALVIFFSLCSPLMDLMILFVLLNHYGCPSVLILYSAILNSAQSVIEFG